MMLSQVLHDILVTIENLNSTSKNRYVADHEIAASLNMTIQQVRDYLDLLKERGYINLSKTFGGSSALTTSRGRLAVQDHDALMANTAKASVVPPGVTDTGNYLTQLRQTLDARFSSGELRTLCFDLKVDYDSLPGAGKADKAREIVDYFNRRDRVSELIAVIKEQRSDISFDDFPGRRPTDLSSLAELLNKLPAIKNLDFYHLDFQTWHTMVKLSLRQVFGEKHFLVTEYDKIAWHTSDKIEDANDQRNLFSESCITAEGLLRTAINVQRTSA